MSHRRIPRALPPHPTLIDPHVQVRWAFSQVKDEKNTHHGQKFSTAAETYIKFLIETNAHYDELIENPRFYLRTYWKVDALVRFVPWLEKTDLKSLTRYSVFKCVRAVMQWTYVLGVVDELVYSVYMFAGIPETEMRTAYSEDEQELINAGIARWIRLGQTLLLGYKPTGEGVKPRKIAPHGSCTLTVNNKTYNVEQASKKFGISKGEIYRRIKMGLSDEQVVGLQPVTESKISFNGIQYTTVADLARAYKQDVKLVTNRLLNGWTYAEALKLEDRNRTCKPVIVDGIEYRSIASAARAIGLNPGQLEYRLKKGIHIDKIGPIIPINPSPKEAVDPIQYYEKVTKTSYLVEGVTYESLAAVGRAYGISVRSFSYYLSFGWTVEEALGIIPRHVAPTDDRAILWDFENRFNCDPLKLLMTYRQENRLTEKRIFDLFVSWGVWPFIDSRIIFPLAFELSTLTGLNPEAIKDLTIDCFTRNHPLTGKPCLSYRKLRAASSTRSAERELHIPLLDIEEHYPEGDSADRIDALINLTLDLTSEIRGRADPAVQRHLFVYEEVRYSGARSNWDLLPRREWPVKSIDWADGTPKSWYKKFVKGEGIERALGRPISFNMAKCRPTLVTNMVLDGADIFQVQAAIGHGSVTTTAKYLDMLQVEPAANSALQLALRNISQRSADTTQPQKNTPASKSTRTGHPDFYETLSGIGCKNPFNPSQRIRDASRHTEGHPCRAWNMCLFCDNSVVTENSLPKLISYRRALQRGIVSEVTSVKTHELLLVNTAAIVDSILKPDAIFPADIISKAEILAAEMDQDMCDHLIFQGL